MNEDRPVNLFDYEALAKARLHPAVWDYIAAGAADEITVAENRRAFDRLAIRPRVLVDVSRIETATSVLGGAVAAPIMIAPAAHHGALCEGAECATAEAAGRAGVVMVAATSSNRSIEEIAAAATGPLWLQLYLFADRARTLALVRRAEAAGCGAIVLTVDAPRWGLKERSLRSEDDFAWPALGNYAELPPDLSERRTAAPHGGARRPGPTSTGCAAPLRCRWCSRGSSPPRTRRWRRRAASRRSWSPTMAAASSMAYRQHRRRRRDRRGGGRRLRIYLDGGVRRGTDVFKALARGARAVLVGRPVLWGLAADGATGAHDVLAILKRELEWAMSLAGRPTLADIDRSAVLVILGTLFLSRLIIRLLERS